MNRDMLKEFGLELVYDYGFWRNPEEEFTYQNCLKKLTSSDAGYDGFDGFGNNYAMILKHMKKNLKDINTVVDLGCAWGIFSYMFKNYFYIGVEEDSLVFKNDCLFRYYDHHKFINEGFPDFNPGGDVFIASMSLGYGGMVSRNKDNAAFKEKFINEISKYKYGYTAVDSWVEGWISEAFNKEPIYSKKIEVKLGEKVIQSFDDKLIFWSNKNNNLQI